MRARLMILLAACVSAPALAQHAGHDAAPPPATVATPDRCPDGTAPARQDPHAAHAAAPGSASRTICDPDPLPPASGATPDPHAGHVMPAAPRPPQGSPASDTHAGHTTPPPAPATADPHAGHPMPAAPAPSAAQDPHADHRMGEAAEAPPVPPVGPLPPEALSGPAHAADTVYDRSDMATAREEVRRESGDLRSYRFLIDQLEVSLRRGRDGYVWDDAQFWYGGDIDKLWIKSQGEGAFGGALESAEVQALWSHAISPWFDLQAGARYDFEPNPRRGYLVLGFQGLAPYWFEVDGALFLSNKGDLSGRIEVEYDQRITQRLILQPRAEADFAFQNVPEIGLGSGLSTAELGLRLRYEFFPARAPAVIAPYVGVQYERAFGNTADFRRAAGDSVGGWRFLLGVRTWF